MKRRLPIGPVACAVLLLVLAACTSTVIDTDSTDTTTPQRGGTIRYATIGEPKTLDTMATTATITTNIAANIYEGLFTLDSHLIAKPSLAESYRLEDQGRSWVIELRKGVRFHNGLEMTSDDVVASLNRWVKIAERGKILFNDLVKIEAPDRYRIVIHLKKPMPVVANLLVVRPSQAAIYPKSVIDAAGNGLLQQYIGTGPYKFGSWKTNQYIELVRFDQYQSRTEPANGMAGRREAFADSIRFIPVPEVQQRVQGVQTGLYDSAEQISTDLYSSITSVPSIEPLIVKPSSFQVMVFNKKLGIFRDLKMRQAVQAAADVQAMMQAAFGDPRFYRLDPGLFPNETKWWSDAGKALYNQKNPAKAKQLMKEAGYQGQTVRILTTRDFDYIYRLTVVLKSQLDAVGMHVVLDVVDFATLTDQRKDPSAYDIFGTGFNPVGDPVDAVFWDASWPGWWVNSRKDSLVQQLAMESDQKKRMDVVSQLQQLWYDDVPVLKIGDNFPLRIKNRKLHGESLSSPFFYLFNCWLSK